MVVADVCWSGVLINTQFACDWQMWKEGVVKTERKMDRD